MELRHLRCFLAVAEELHFARALERLHIALDVPPEKAEKPVRDIRVELKRGSARGVVHWPVEVASSCAAWLREWLR